MENHGVLVGWQHQDLASKLMVTIQSVRHADTKDVDLLRLVMTKEQATILGHDLIRLAGQTPPSRRDRSWIRRIFG